MTEIPPKERSLPTLATALVKAAKSFPAIEADASNPFFNSGYSSLAYIIKVTTPVLSANGLAIMHDIETIEGNLLLVTRLLHVNGEERISAMPLVNKKGDMQGYGSAISYAKRFQIMCLLNLATSKDDDDGNAASHQSAATDLEF